MLFAANKPASELPFHLTDLLTRLAQAPTFKVPNGRDLADRQALLQSILRRRGWQFDERIVHHLLHEGPHRIGAMMEVLNYIQPMFSNLGRSNISKAVISDALRTIDEQTLAAELADITQETQVDNDAANQDQHTMPLDFKPFKFFITDRITYETYRLLAKNCPLVRCYWVPAQYLCCHMQQLPCWLMTILK